MVISMITLNYARNNQSGGNTEILALVFSAIEYLLLVHIYYQFIYVLSSSYMSSRYRMLIKMDSEVLITASLLWVNSPKH
jgi:hypothetical protein